MALRDAGIEQYNLVYVSSIFPPECKIIDKEEGVKYLSPGKIVFCVLSKNQTNVPGDVISASVGVAIPENNNLHGYIAEHSGSGGEEEAIDYAKKLAEEMIRTKYGSEVEILSKGIGISQKNIDGEWLTVVAGVVFII